MRIRSLARHLRARFGARVRKLPLDAGFSCPNRDRTLSDRGCVFCNARGSGSGLGRAGLTIREQWEIWRRRIGSRYKARLYLAYLQSFSNTYGPAGKVASVLAELEDLPELAGLCLATRPDCLDAEKLKLIAMFASRPDRETWLEIGLQSANDATLLRINRGHDAAAFADAATHAARLGLKVCAHVIMGLPGEGIKDFLATLSFVNRLPVAGVKLHNLYVARDTELARDLARGRLGLMEREEYVEAVVQGLSLLRPDVVVHRLASSPARGELVGPTWADDKRGTILAILDRMEALDLRQGSGYRP